MNKTITIKQLLIILISFIFGLVTILLIQNFLSNEIVQFETIELIGFVLSIIIGGSSIILAVTAINLGKSSEKIIISRNEKSIELQNEVYIKTTEALNRIESSTDVTEKRIEDIISGRVGDLASRLIDDKIVPESNKTKLETKLRKSLSKELTEDEKIAREERLKNLEIASKKHKELEDKVLMEISNMKESTSLRISQGDVDGKGEGVLDGLFEINNKKIGICVFYSYKGYEDEFNSGIDINKFLNKIAEEISNNTFDKVYIVFEDDSKITENFQESMTEIKRLYKQNISENIELFIGSEKEIVNKLMEYAT